MTQAGGDNIAKTPGTLARTAVERSNLYRFLARVFGEEVSAEFLRRIKEAPFQQSLAAAAVELEGDFMHRPEEALLEELAVEYARLFLGPGKHISPHASVHQGPDGGGLWGPPTIEVKRFIEAAGFEYKAEFHGMPDHISVALEFMAEIAAQEARAWRREDFAKALNCLRYEKEFIGKHVAGWAAVFCAKVKGEAELSFYREMAGLTAAFFASEQPEIARRKRIAERKG